MIYHDNKLKQKVVFPITESSIFYTRSVLTNGRQASLPRDFSSPATWSRVKMATGGDDKSVDSRVTCSVCLEPYTGQHPKLLPCFHTFCTPCLIQLVDRDSQHEVGVPESLAVLLSIGGTGLKSEHSNCISTPLNFLNCFVKEI